ncbi:MAG: cation transporter [Pseudomonadota bacterium]
MSEERQIKKITLDTLKDEDKKATTVKLKKIFMGFVVIAVAAVGIYFVYGMLSGDLVASRFSVNNMTCPACVITIKEATEKAPGVAGTDISLSGREITVKFYEKKTSPEQIEKVIEKAGYPVKLDGLFKPAMVGKDDTVVASVNGRPVLLADLNTDLDVELKTSEVTELSSTFFSTIGKEILLQEADKNMVVVQPQEVIAEIQNIAERLSMTEDQFKEKVKDQFGSLDKFTQVVGQRLGILKLLEDKIPGDIQDSVQRRQKAIELIGSIFKDSDVRIFDLGVREKIRAVTGQDDWKVFWPRMIASDTELNRLVKQTN